MIIVWKKSKEIFFAISSAQLLMVSDLSLSYISLLCFPQIGANFRITVPAQSLALEASKLPLGNVLMGISDKLDV